MDLVYQREKQGNFSPANKKNVNTTEIRTSFWGYREIGVFDSEQIYYFDWMAFVQ